MAVSKPIDVLEEAIADISGITEALLLLEFPGNGPEAQRYREAYGSLHWALHAQLRRCDEMISAMVRERRTLS